MFIQPRRILYAASTTGHLRCFHLPYLEALAATGWQVDTASRGEAPVFFGAGEHYALPFKKKLGAPGNFRLALHLAGILRQRQYALIVTNTSLAAFFVRLAVKLAGKGQTRVVNIVHGYLFDRQTPAPKRRLMLAAEQLMAGVTDDLLVMNYQDWQLARRYHLCRGSVRQIAGVGVDFNRFFPVDGMEKQRLRRELGLAEDAFVLVYAAEFSPRKNQQFLIGALARLPEQTVLLLPGQGDLLLACQEQVQSAGLTGRVLFPGFSSQIERFYQAADLTVSSSRYEGLPFNVMEAMHCSLPAVVSRVKGNEDLVIDGENGYTYEYGDPHSFVAAIWRLWQDKSAMQSLGCAARRSVAQYARETVSPSVLAGILGNSASTLQPEGTIRR